MNARVASASDRAARRGVTAGVATLWLAVFAPPLATAAPPAAAARAAAAPAPSPAAVYQRECGDCHLAYPARLLPAADWRRIVAALERHFGVDATLDPADLAVVAGWLDVAARAPRRDDVAIPASAPGTLPRITTGAWFRHEHDEIGAATWKRAAIGSPARCEACHLEAAKGRFDEHAIRIPR